MISSYFSVAVLFNHGSTFSSHSHLMNMDMTSPLSPRRLAEEEKGYNIRDKDYVRNDTVCVGNPNHKAIRINYEYFN